MLTNEAPQRLRSNSAWMHSLAAYLISRLGDLVFDVTIVLWITVVLAPGKPWAPAAVSAVLLGGVIPDLIFGPLAGVYADRHDRRRMMLTANWVQAVFIGSLLLAPSFQGIIGVPGILVWIFIAVFVTNAAGQFFAQGRLALLVVAVPDSQRTEAFGVQGALVNMLSIVGPPLAAPLMFSVGVMPALAVNAVSFVLSSLFLRAVPWRDDDREGAAAPESAWASLKSGAVAVATSPVLRALVVCITIVTLAAGAMTVLEVFFVTDVLAVRATLVGVMMMAYAAGNVIGGLLAARIERKLGGTRSFIWGLIVAGALFMLYSRMTDFYVALVLYFIVAVPLGVLNTVLGPLCMRSASPEMLGRAMAALNTFPTVASLAAMSVAGWLASTVLRDFSLDLGVTHFRAIDTIFFICGCLVLLAGLYAYAEMRDLDRTDGEGR